MLKIWSPTRGRVRGIDKWGNGHFGAPRGDHLHRGSDFIVNLPNSGDDFTIISPVSGSTERRSRPYPDGPYSGICIKEASGSFTIKMFYFKAFDHILAPDYWLFPNLPIGVAQNIGEKYPGMIPHIHTEIELNPEILIVYEYGRRIEAGLKVFIDPERLL